MTPSDTKPKDETGADPVDRAADIFLRRRTGLRIETDDSSESSRQDPAQANALGRVARAWHAVGEYADSPELMVLREQALSRARRASLRRWYMPTSSLHKRWLIAASIAAAATIGGGAWQLSPYAIALGTYQTHIGEQKSVELEDHSTMVMDAKTRLRIRYSNDARVVEIMEGQAQFAVTQDARRPFKVIAGERTIVALGTTFTVEYLDREVKVAMLDGRVAVFASNRSGKSVDSSAAPIELSGGEALRVRPDGTTKVTPKADLAAATAWRHGEVVFHDEPLGEAIQRLNHYSRVQLQLKNPQLAQLSVSGLFEAGDTRAFAHALQSYLPVVADESEADVIELRVK